jgi:peroxiredoxin Q/BCP
LEGNSATIRSRFLDFDGKTVLHCHNLDHEDLGMMQVVQIVNPAGGAAPKAAPARGFSGLPQPAPDWSLKDTEGRPVRFADYQGRPLLLVFHRGLDCLHCAEQIKALAQTEPMFRALGVELAAVSPQWPDQAAVRAAREELGIRFPLLADPGHHVFGRFGCQGEPPLHGTFLIDADGLVRWQSVGELPVTDMNRLLDQVRVFTPLRACSERTANTVLEVASNSDPTR